MSVYFFFIIIYWFLTDFYVSTNKYGHKYQNLASPSWHVTNKLDKWRDTETWISVIIIFEHEERHNTTY